MIYTVTFNPSLDYIVSVENFRLGLTNRTSSELMLPGGKGVNVSTVLMNLGIENTALGFVAGFVGDKIMERLDGRGVQIVVDATKDLLLNVLEYHPFLIKPNNHELGELFGVELKTREEVIPYAKKLQEKGAVNVLVSMAGEGAVLIDANEDVHMAPAPKGTLVNGVGAGDSMVAGFMTGWLEKQDYEHAFCMGVSAGSASAFSEHLATKAEIEAVYQQVTGNK